MQTKLFFGTLIAASFALSVPAFADGSGTSVDPYTGSASELNPNNSDGTSGVVYIQNITGGYWAKGSDNALTISSNLYITYNASDTYKNGITFNNGYSDTVYTFTGSISGDGNWTFNGSGISQQYIFLGDMSGYSGNIDYSTERASDDHPSYFHFGNGGQAATDTNISGTGSITQHGNITYNYSSYATGGDSAITIGNSSLKAETIEFAGSVNYNVSSTTVTGYDTSATLTISNTGTTTFTGTVSGFGTVTVTSSSTLAVGTGGSLDLTGATVDLSSTIQNLGTVTVDSSTTFVLDNLTSGSSGSTDYYIIVSGTGTIDYSGDASFTHNGITLNWEIYNEDGYFVVYGDHISDLTWNGTSSNNTWSTDSTDAPWSSSGGTTTDSGFNNGDSVTFSSSTAEKSVIVSGAVEASSMTVSEGGYSFSSDTTSGGTIKTSSLTFKVARGDTMTIAVSDADLGVVSISRLDTGETNGDNYRVLIIGNGTATTMATASSLTLLGASEISVAKDSILTVTGNVDFNGGYSENVSGEGTLIVNGTATHSTGGTLSISVANFQAETFTKTSSGATIFSGEATIGTFNAASGSGSQGNTITLSEGAKLTVGTLSNAWGANFVLEAGSVLEATSANFSTGSEGYTVSGVGTFKADSFTIANVSNYTFSDITLDVGTFSVTAGNSLALTNVNSTIGSLSLSSSSIPVTFTGGNTEIGSLGVSGGGSITFSGGSVDIESITFEQGTLTFTGGGTYNIGTYENSATNGWVNNSKTLAIGDNTTVTAETFSVSWHETVTFGANSVLTVTGELSLHTNDTETFSGGTINAEKLSLSNYATTPIFSRGTLNIGSGGIENTGTGYVAFGDNLTVGVYAGVNNGNTSWSTSAEIHFTGVATGTTFYTEANQNITLSGTLSGTGFSNTGSGSLTLSGTVELSSSITNSGTIIVNSSTQFVLDNLKSDGNGTYVIINNVDSGSITNWGSLNAGNFYFTDGTEITGIDFSTAGQITISTNAVDLIWNGGSGTWDTSSSNWTISGTGTSSPFTKGDYITFTGNSGDSFTVNVQGDGGVYAAYVTVSGGTYSFTGSSITVREYFVINSGAEVDLGESNSTIYGDFIVDGTLKLAGSSGSSGEIHGTITINEGGRVELDKGDVTGWGEGQGVTAITINKGGTLYVGITDNQTLGGCTLTLVGGTITGVDGSNLDLYHSSSKIFALAEDSATADNPTVSTVNNVTLTPRASDSNGGATEFFVDENAKLVVNSGIRAGAGGNSTYNCDLEKTGTGTLEVSGFFALNTGSLIIDEGTVILSGKAGYSSLSYGFASSVSVASGALLNICFSEDTTLSGVTFSGAGTIEVSGSNTLTINNYSFSGTTTIAEGSTLTLTGATSVSNLELGSGTTLTLSSGNNTSNTSLGTVTVSTSATITSGYYEYVSIGTLAGSGTLALSCSVSDARAMIYELTGTAGTSSFSGTISLSDTNSNNSNRGVTLVISSEKAAAGAVIEMGAELSSDALALGVNASRVEIAGLVSNNSGGDIIYSGSVSLGATLGDQGATLADYSNQDSYGSGSNYDGVGTSRNTLVINTVADTDDYSFTGNFLDKVNIEKTGGGTQSITFKEGTWQSENYFDGTIVVKEGTLNLSAETVTKGDASEKATTVNSSGITVAQGATLNIANDITLTKASDLESCSSTISGNLGLSGTLTVSSDATLAIGSTASVTINSAISNAGTITIAEGASIVVGVDAQTYNGTNGNVGYYVLIDGSGGGSVTLNGSVTFVINGESITLSEITTMADGGTTWKGYTVGGYLVIYEATTAAETANTLYWAGTENNSTWSTRDSDTPWSATDGGDAGLYFADGEDVIFGTGASYKTVTVVGDVAPGSITVNSEYTFDIDADASVTTGALTYGAGGSLTLTGSGTFVFRAEVESTVFTISSSDDFTGNVEVVKGRLQLSGTILGENTGVILHASTDGATEGSNIYGDATAVSIVFGGDGASLANDITILGDGAVIIRSGGVTGTLSGNISAGENAAYLQLNGGGSVTLSGDVDLSNGGYVNYQGSTTFSGSTVTLGELVLAQNTDGTSAVTFTNSVQATVGTLTVDSTGTDGAQKTLIVSGGAALEITTGIALNHEVDIKLDNGTLKITGTEYSTSGNDAKMSVTISNGGTLSLGENVTLNVDVMNIVLSEANCDESGTGAGVYAIVGGNDSSLTFTDNAVITITVDSALETLLSSEGTYYFDISNGIALNEGSLDYSALESYGTVSYTDGILSVVVPIPEPELFSIFFGIGTLGLIATRRRRRKVA